MIAAVRCFVAVEPPPELTSRLRELERPDRPGLRWTRPEQWHVTLHFLAAVDPEALLEAMDGLVWADPVVAEAGPAPTALSRQVWVLPVAGLDGLASSVAGRTAGLADDLGEDRRFRGHLTLARARDPKALRGLPTPAVVARWSVREVVAFRSELLPRGARHHEIGRWPVGSG